MQSTKPFVLNVSTGIQISPAINNQGRDDIFTNQLSLTFYEDDTLIEPVDATTITGTYSLYAKPTVDAAWQTLAEDVDLSDVINQIYNMYGAATYYKITCPTEGDDQPNVNYINITTFWGLE